MSNHTPLPWETQMGEEAREINSSPATGQSWKAIANVPANDLGSAEVTDDEATANAQFIVRACNAHYELLAACQRLLATNGHIDGCICTACESGHGAIAKAKGA